jgi:predicted AAA+ superfamily ATPase
MNGYRKRVLDHELDELASLPALAIEGPKGVGKTETAGRRAETIIRLDDPAQQEIAAADTKRVMTGDPPILLDEWQRVPAVWDAVRRAVDDKSPPGPFFLTRSAMPQSDRDPPRHSGAARIDVLRMRPMTLAERTETTGTVSLRDLLDATSPEIGGDSDLTLDDYTDEIIRSGFPGIRDLEGRAHKIRITSYLGRIVDREFQDELGRSVRRPESLRRWMAAYGAATATTTSYKKIGEAAAPGEDAIPKRSADAYRDALTRLFILDPVPGWTPSNSQLRRLAQAPKHHLADPALAVSLLGLTKSGLLRGDFGSVSVRRHKPFLGALFESLVCLTVRVLAQALDARVFHMRTQDGRHEIDLIVESPSGEVVAIEVKLAQSVDGDDCRHLNWLDGKIGDRLKARMVVTTGPSAYRREDGVCVVPLALLSL